MIALDYYVRILIRYYIMLRNMEDGQTGNPSRTIW